MAESAVGEPVKVGPLPAAYAGKCAGLAGWDGKSYTLALAEDLEPEALLEAVYHECAHFVLGHVSKAAPTPAWSSPLPPALSAYVAELRQAEEAEAERWAHAQLDRMNPWARAILAELCAC